MKLTVRELAKVMDVTEGTLERWIRNDGLPHQRVHGQARFHLSEVLEWANERGIRVATNAPASAPGRSEPRLADALAAGGIHYGIRATDRESLLRALIDRIPLADDADRELLFEVFLARERSGSTGIGDGIAIPHVRNPVVLPVDRPCVTLGFLETPVDFGAIDGKPVHTVFTIVAPTIRMHLSLLARLAGMLHDEAFRAALLERAPAESILALAGAAEAKLAGGAAAE